MNIILSHLSFPISGTDLKDKKVVPKWYMGPKGDNKRVYRHNLTTKGNCHIEHRKNVTREWVEEGSLTVSHVNRKCNPSDIFTKEM